MTTIKLGPLAIPLDAYASQGSAILGIRDSGKTYTATWFAEQVFEAGVPFIAFDPIGVWRFLRVPGKGRGYPVVVAGGQEGDLPLTVASAPEIVRAAMNNGVSLVIDLFDINLSKADWKRIVTACVRVLLHENARHGLRHVFIEEAAEFAPQRVGPDQGQVYAEIEKLARMGGNSRLGYTLINQRAEEVNKAVLELCDNLFLHRQKGKNSLNSLTKWLDVADVKAARDIIKSLPMLPQGECWAWLAGTENPVHVKVPVKNSLHPDRRIMRGDVAAATKSSVDVGSFVEKMRGTLGKIEEEAKANDPKVLRAEIADLRRRLAAAGSVDPEALAQAERRGFLEAAALGNRALLDYAANVDKITSGITAALSELDGLRLMLIQGIEDATARVPAQAPQLCHPQPRPAPRYEPARRPNGNGAAPSRAGEAMGAERRPLAVLASVYPAGMTEAQWAVAAGMKRTGGTWSTYKSRLKSAGRIEQRGNEWAVTPQGIDDLGSDVEQMPAPGMALVEFWASRVSGAAPMLRHLAKVYPRQITRDDLAAALDLSVSGGTFSTYLSRLRSPGLIEDCEGRTLRASPSLMGTPARHHR